MNELLRYRNIIIAVVIAAVFSLIIYSIYVHYSEQLDELKAKRLELQKGKETIARWGILQQRYGELNRWLLRGDTARFKQFVEEKARLSDIYMTSLNLGREDKDFYWKVSIDFEANCFYRDLIKFARLLEEKKVKIVSAVIGKQSGRAQMSEGIALRGRLEGIVVK